MKHQELRDAMAKNQLVARGISDPKVLNAFRRVPRHLFVPEKMRASAYDDRALPIGEEQTISQPYMVAIMTEQLKLKGNEKVLEVGTGSGYQAAILAELCKQVYSIERLAALSRHAQQNVKEAGYNNVKFIVGDGTLGYPAEAPYESIIVTAGCPKVPPSLIDQLREGGRLVLPLGDRYQQILTTVVKGKDRVEFEESVPCVFVPLIGKFGWEG